MDVLADEYGFYQGYDFYIGSIYGSKFDLCTRVLILCFGILS